MWLRPRALTPCSRAPHARTHARTSPSHRHRHRHRHHHRHRHRRRHKRHAARPIRGGIVSRPYATPSAADGASASMRRRPCVQCIAVPPHSKSDVDVDVNERAIARGAPRCERGQCYRLFDMAGDTAAILGSIAIKSRWLWLGPRRDRSADVHWAHAHDMT